MLGRGGSSDHPWTLLTSPVGKSEQHPQKISSLLALWTPEVVGDFPIGVWVKQDSIAKKFSVVLDDPSLVICLRKIGFTWSLFFVCACGWSGLEASTVPCLGYMGHNERTQETHCHVIPKVLKS